MLDTVLGMCEGRVKRGGFFGVRHRASARPTFEVRQGIEPFGRMFVAFHDPSASWRENAYSAPRRTRGASPSAQSSPSKWICQSEPQYFW